MPTSYPPLRRSARLGRLSLARVLSSAIPAAARKIKCSYINRLHPGLYALLALPLLAVGARAQANLLVSGDFEGISSLSTYPVDTTGVWGTESAVLSGAGNGITPFGSQMLLIRHAGGGHAAQTNQVVYGPFKAGSVATFSVKFNTWLAASGSTPQTVAVSLTTDSGIALTSPAYTSPTVALDTDTSTWQTATVQVILPSDTNYLSAEIILWQYSGALPYGTPLAYADDAVLTVVRPVNWVNWTGTETTGGITKYVGQMVVPRTDGSSTTVIVKYTPPNQNNGGNGYPGVWDFQSSNGVDYFQQVNSLGQLVRDAARSPYTSALVPNIPDGGGAPSDRGDIIELRYHGTNTLEFTDTSGNPIAVASPIFAYVSLNGNGYGFDQDFDILSFGDGIIRDRGYFGAGSSKKAVVVDSNGVTQYQLLQDTNPLGGTEPHGALQFRGAFSKVTWQSLNDEVWNGFTIGVAQLAADVPIANAGPDQTVTQDSPNGATVQLSGSVSGSTHTPFTFTWSGPFGTASGENPTVTLPVGTNTVTLTVVDAAGASDADTVVITVLPNPPPVITSPTVASGTYGSAFSYTITATHSPTAYGATNLPAGLTLSGAVISGAPTETGAFGVQLSARNSGGVGTSTLLLSIAPAPSTTTTVGAGPFTYDGTTHGGGSGTVTGANLNTSATSVTYSANPDGTGVADRIDAGTYYVTAHYAGDANHTASDGAAVAITINKAATTTTTVGAGPFTYDGTTHAGGSGNISGPGTITGSATLTYSGDQLNAGSYTVTAHYAGDANHTASDGAAVTITINKAASTTTTVGAGPFTYDGTTHAGGSGNVSGPGTITGSATVTYSGDQVDAGSYTVTAHYAGDANHTASDGAPVTIIINRAPSLTTTIGDGPFTYDGTTHFGGAGTVTGINLNTGATSLTYSANADGTGIADQVDAGTYYVTAHYAGDANHTGSDGAPVAITIAPAPSATTTVGAGPFTYDGTTHGGGSGTVTGVNLSTSATSVTYSANADGTGTADRIDAGTYYVTAHYAGDANHTGSDGAAVAITINKAATTTTLAAVPSVQAANQPVTLTATVSSQAAVTSGTVTFTNGSTTLGTVTVDGSGVAVFTTTALPLGPQSITATYSGSSNFIGSASSAVPVLIYGYPSGGGTFVIGDGNATAGATVNFWGSQWERTNSLTGGASNASFKGFAVGPNPPAVGGTFTAAPGNSGPSPATVPAYMGVIVTSKVTKSRSGITGTIVKVVVVKVNPGYAGDPGHAGTGTVVGVVP